VIAAAWVIALGLGCATPAEDAPPGDGAARAADSLGPSAPASPRVPSSDGPARAEEAAFTVAGAATAGFVGGMLIAGPALLATAPLLGPFVAVPIAILVLSAAGAFGAFVGELAFARLGTAGLVAATAAAATALGTTIGVLAGAALGSLADRSGEARVGLLLGGVVGGVALGLVGAAAGGGGGALWLTPAEP
jgi:hypothetical protein